MSVSDQPQNNTAPCSPLPQDKELVLKVMPMPADCNANGDIFGGWVMAQVDLAGSVLPARLARGRIATVAVNEFIFKHPVRVGDLLSFYAGVERIGKTSMQIKVEVYAEQIRPFIKKSFIALGTNGFGRSDTREHLRNFFEVDRHWVTVAALKALADDGTIGRDKVAAAINKYQLDPNKPNPMTV